jgi:cell division septal protein FtsQ
MRTKSGKKVKTKRPVRKAQGRSSASGKSTRLLGQFVLPFVICLCLAVCLGALGYLGYQRVAASDFFEVRRVEIAGVQRASRQNIERLVKTETERTGVWRADLLELKARIEKVPFVKTASVTRVLPGGVRVQVTERQPQAIVLRNGREYLADADGEILAVAERREENLPFVMVGWDESKTEKAWKDNIERVKIYQKMLAEWRVANLVSRVESVNLVDLREPRAIIPDSGTTVSIAVGREDFGVNLSNGVMAIVGKGDMFEGVNLVGSNMILAPRKQN